MRTWIHYLPLITTVFSVYFFILIYKHWKTKRQQVYLMLWASGVLIYGTGTFMESWVTLFGWNEIVFKLWYITGAILGGVILAQGSVYLLMKRRFANISGIIVLIPIVTAIVLILLSPVNYELVETHRLTGKVLEWSFVRLFTPFINIYAFVFLVGGAIYSAIRYFRQNITGARFTGNLIIALGGLLPGIG